MRPPSVFVRALSPAEGQRLKQLSRKAEHFSTRQRAAILLASASQHSVPEIARMLQTDDSHARKVIKDFNERGLDSLRPNFRGGRPRRITDCQRERIVAIAGARPDEQEVPLTRWSLRHLAAHLSAHEEVEISPPYLGQILKQAGLSFQRTRSWKASPDPDRVIALVKRPPKGSAVIAFDQMAYNRRHGVRYGFGAYDVGADRLRLRLRPRRRGRDGLAFMRQIRLCYPRRIKLYWIQDNLSANWTPEIREFAADNNIELVATPTYASYLNPIECHFWPIAEFVVKNADYLDWDSFAVALARHIGYRNGPHRDRRLAAAEAKLRVAA